MSWRLWKTAWCQLLAPSPLLCLGWSCLALTRSATIRCKANWCNVGEAGIDINQGALRLSETLDFDQSPGTSVGGNPALVYNSETVAARPVIWLTVQGNPIAIASTQAQIAWTFNGTTQTTVTEILNPPVNGVYQVAMQPDDPVSSTGAYTWSATVTFSNSTGGASWTVSASGTVYAVVRDSSPYGAGWGLAGISQLVTVSGGVLWVTGQGDWRFFASTGDGTFTSPPEDFGTLVQNDDGSYTYTEKNQTLSNFSSAGLLTSVVDTHGLTLLSYTYDSEGRLTQVHALDGGVTTLTYDGTTGLLNTITEPGSRVLTLTHDTSGNLTQITDVDSTTRTFSYDSNHHLTEDQWSPLDATFSYNSSTGLLTGMNRGLGSTYAVVSAAAVALGNAPAGSTPTYPSWASAKSLGAVKK